MSFNQARAERSESHYRRPGRPGNPVYQRVSSGGVGKGGGGTGLPPASANSQSSTNRSLKKSNGQWAQSRVTVTSANSESSAVHNGARAQPSLQDVSAKSTDMHNQRSHQTASSAPTSASASASGTSESTAPTTPVRADTSKGVSLQFGSFSPNIVTGMQIPARTSSAPPNLHEQKCDQARHDSFRSDPLLPTSISNRQQPREDVEQSKSTVPHPPSSDKRSVRAQASAYSGATSAKNSSTPLSGASMAIPFHQSRVVQFGVPAPQIQAQGTATTSLQMSMQQQMFVPSFQAPPLQPQGMMHQGQGLNFPPQVGHQISSQMGDLVIGMGSHFAQQQPRKLGAPRISIKITDPKTHEELRLDKRADTDLDGGLSGQGSHPNMPLQPQPIVYGPSHQVNYFSHIHPNSVFFQNPASLSLTSTTQMAPNSQASVINYVGGQGSHVLAFKNPSLLNHSSAYKTGPPMHGMAVSSNLEPGRRAETLISAASSVSEQVAVKPAAGSLEDRVVPASVLVSSNADNTSEVMTLLRSHMATQSLHSQGDSKIHLEISVQQSKSISVPSSPGRTETVRRVDSIKDQLKPPQKKDQHHFQMQQQADISDSADCSAMKAYKEVAKCTENKQALSEKVEPSASVLADPLSGLEHITSASNKISETVESEATRASSETFQDVAVSTGEALPGGVACVSVASVEGTDSVQVVEGCVCETSNKSSGEIVFDELNGVSSAKQDDCTSLDIQLKNENTGLVEQMKTEESKHPQLDNNYSDDGVNITAVLPSNTSDHCKNLDITQSAFCNKLGPVETEQNILEGALGCGSIVNEKTDNNTGRSTAFADCCDSDVGAHIIVSSSSEVTPSTLEGTIGKSGFMDGREASLLESGLARDDTAHIPIPSVSDSILKVSEEENGDLVQFPSTGWKDNKHTMELNKMKSTTAKVKKTRKEICQKADLAGTTSDLYMAYKGPEEKPQPSVSSGSVDSNPSISIREPHSGSNEEDIACKEHVKSIAEPDDWEDAADMSLAKLENSDKVEETNGGLTHHEDDGAACKKYSRDFLLTLKDRCVDLPAGFDIAYDMVEALMGSKLSISISAERNPPPSSGRVIDRPIVVSRPDFRGAGMVNDDRWLKSPIPFPFNQDHHVDMGQVGNTVGFRLGQGGSHGIMRNLRGQTPGQYIVGLQSGPLLPLESHGGIQRNGPDADRWQRASGFQKGLIPSPQSPMQVIHKAANKYEVGKVTDAEAAKQRQLKAILNKLTPQNFDRLFEQVKEVNIDNAVTLTGVISQIFDKALMEPTFCEMYANFCHDLAGELPDFVEDNEKITFKRLLLNKCQEEFERGEREQAEADKVDGDGKVKQSAVEREEKRVQARRRMLGNIRLIGELYKKRMLTERIMHECIQKLLGQYPNPEEEDIEALCKLMSTIGEMIDHPKAKEHMDVYFETMTNLSTNMKLSSRVRFMLKDSIDLRKNKWQQRRKVDGPKKIEEVHRDAAQERQQVNRLARSSSISSSSRRGQPSDFGPRASIMFSPPTTPQGAFRGGPPQLRGFGTQGIRFEDRHPYENRTLSVPLSHRPVDDNVITLGPQGGLARGMSMRGPAILSGAPLADVSTDPGESRRIRAGPNGYSSATEWMLNNSRQEPMTRNVQERFMRSPAYDHSNSQEHGVYYGDRDLNNADRSFDRSMAGSAATHVKSSATPVVSSGKVWPEERLRDMSMAAIREFYRLIGELYKKRMLTERIMHECIKKLLGQYPDPEEEDIEALCKLMSTIGEMIDHPKAKEHMDAYFERMTNLSTNMKLSSRVRFMLKDSIDLRKNKWQQRRKVDGPKKIEEVHRDAAQERQQVNRLTRSSSISSSARRGQPSDFGPRPSTMFSPPNTPQGTFRGVPPQLRGFGTQGIRFEDRHPYENRTLSVPLSHRPVDDNAITLGPQGGLARGMSIRGPAILSSAPLADISTGPGESRRIHAGPNGYSSASEWMPSNSRQEPMTRYVQERFTRPAAYNNLNPQEHGVRYGDRGLNNADRSFGSSMAGSPAATHVKSSATPIVSSGKVWPEERLRDKSMAAIREFYSAADEKEVALCIRELNSPSFYPSMISIWVNDSFERKDRDRDLLAGLLVNLTKSRDSMLISPVQLMEGIELVLATLEDSITDAPKAAEFLGCVIARTIVENVISMRDIGQLIRQGGEEPGRLLQIGLGYEVLQSAFHTIRSDKGESTLNDICTSSNLQLEDFLPSSGPIN